MWFYAAHRIQGSLPLAMILTESTTEIPDSTSASPNILHGGLQHRDERRRECLAPKNWDYFEQAIGKACVLIDVLIVTAIVSVDGSEMFIQLNEGRVVALFISHVKEDTGIVAPHFTFQICY